MFQTLHIQGYRRFKDYRLENLSRVNLLVGDNNSGKTSVLEAVHLIIQNDANDAFLTICNRRGEQVFRPSDRNPEEGRWYPTVASCFSDHTLELGKSIRIETHGEDDQSFDIELTPLSNASSLRSIGRFDRFMAVRFQSNEDAHPLFFGIDDEGAFDRTVTWDPRTRRNRVSHLLGAEMTSTELRQFWDRANYRNRNEVVVDALRNIHDNIDRIHFDGVAWPPLNPRTAVKVGASGFPELVPIGSLGQGVYRMLELALGLVASENGVFLVDEIDNGFHWSRMGDIWKFVIETARETNTQVFATTHSEDCIRGLDWVCSQFPDLAEEISIQTLKPSLDFAISLPGTRLPDIVRSEIEVR